MKVSDQLHPTAALAWVKESLCIHWLGGLMGPERGLAAVTERNISDPDMN
jgi:hypothetical protein